jgi:hypothetical protein
MLGEGMKVRFVPYYEFRVRDDDAETRQKTITGTIVYINWEHQFFVVEYGDKKLKESFKFHQIGREVKICGRY